MSAVAKLLHVTCYGGRPRPLCYHTVLHGDPDSPKERRSSPQFSAHVCCGQTAGRIKMPLGTEVDLSPGHIVSDGSQLPRGRGRSTPPPLLGQTVAHLSYC